MAKKLYMISAGDELDLPIAVAESVAILSKMVGISETVLYANFCKARHPDRYPKCKSMLKKYHTIELEDEDEEEGSRDQKENSLADQERAFACNRQPGEDI